MVKRLTDISAKAFKPREARFAEPDGGCTGLYLEVMPSGTKSWKCRYRFAGKPRNLTLGRYPLVTLAQARVLATAARGAVAAGDDPAAEKRAAKAAVVDRSRDTVKRLAEQFLEQHAKAKTRKSSWRAVERTFQREVLPRWGGRLVTDVSRKDVRELLRVIKQTRPIAANRCKAYLSRFFRWLVNEDYLVGSPMVGMEQPAKENVRDRALSDDELRRFWAATDTLPKPFGDIYKLLLASGARRQEVGELQWGELDLARRVWTLPARRSKSKVSHLLPLGPLAWSIIEAQPRIVGSDYVFGYRRSGFSHFKKKLDEVMRPDQPWVNHDLRRSARSLLARAGVPDNVAELMLGHLLTGMAKVYNVHQYLKEKRDGFEKLEREIGLILNPPAADVIPLRR